MKGIDMTKGKVTPLLIKFAIPLMLGDLFQQLYISVDSAIVGRCAGDIALAAVGANTFLIRLIIGLFVGISAGASVVIAHCVGAKEIRGCTSYNGSFNYNWWTCIISFWNNSSRAFIKTSSYTK